MREQPQIDSVGLKGAAARFEREGEPVRPANQIPVKAGDSRCYSAAASARLLPLTSSASAADMKGSSAPSSTP